MEITWVLAAIAIAGAVLAAYFAKLWLAAKAELAELHAHLRLIPRLIRKQR